MRCHDKSPASLWRKMKQVRSLSHKTIMHRKQHWVRSKCLPLWRTCTHLKAPAPPVTRSVRDMCCIIHSSTPLSVTATICVGYHVVILFRHSAYDVCGSVTADVTFPIGAINKPCAAMACCGLHSCPNKQFNQFV